jgi:hypothetical protein
LTNFYFNSKTYGIIVAVHNPSSGPLPAQVPDPGTDNLFFRGNRPLNATATHSLLAVLANADATMGNVVLSDYIRGYILNDDTRANDHFLKEIQNSLPA